MNHEGREEHEGGGHNKRWNCSTRIDRVLYLHAPIYSAQAAITQAATPMIDNNQATTEEQEIEPLKLDPASGLS